MAEVIILVTSISTMQAQEVLQRATEQCIAGHFLRYRSIDGAAPENKDLRNTLFSISNRRGEYPQVFIHELDGGYTFIGGGNEISKLSYDMMNE